MPAVALVAAIAAASTSAALIAASVAVTTALMVGVAVAASMAIMTLAMQPSIPKYQVPDQASTLSTTSDPKAVLPVCYGSTRTGTILAYKDVDKSRHYLVQIFAVAEGEIDCFKQIYMDNKPVLYDGQEIRDGILAKNQIKDIYQKNLQIEVSTGKKDGRFLALANKYLPEKWKQDGLLAPLGKGVATMCIVMFKNQDGMNNGVDILQENSQVSVDINGLLITDLTDGVRKCSHNGPSQLFHYLTQSKYGQKVQPDQLDLDSFKAAARNAQFSSDGSTDPNATVKQNIINLCASFAGVTFESFGKLTCQIDQADIISQSFDESSIEGSTIRFETGGSDGYFNTLNVQYFDPEMSYSPNILRYPSQPEKDPTIIKDGREITKDITYHFVKNTQALDALASVERNKCKLRKKLSFSTLEAFGLKVWSVIKVNFSELKLTDSLWRVMSITPNFESGMIGMVTIDCVEYDSRVYADKDFAAKPDYTGTTISSDIYTPFNLRAISVDENVYGRNVLVTWDCTDDFNRYSFCLQYKPSDQDKWIDGAIILKKEYLLTGLNKNTKYDFRVCAAGIWYQSPWVVISNMDIDFQYGLPKPSVRLRNAKTPNGNETLFQDFHIEWDDQTTAEVTINGQKRLFGDLFDRYDVRVTHKNGKTVTYPVKDLHWIYTLSMNQQNGLSRNVEFGVTAVGYNGIKSEEAVLSCFNAQVPGLNGFAANPGFGTIFTTWIDPDRNLVPDFAGVVIQVADQNDAGFKNPKSFVSPNAFEIHSVPLKDGSYYVRIGGFDVFGEDNIIFTNGVYVTLTSINWTDADQAALDQVLNMEGRLDAAVEAAFERSKDALQQEIANVQVNIANNTNNAIKVSENSLKQIISASDKTVTDLVTKTRNEITLDTATKLAAQVTKLENTITSASGASATSMQQVKAELQTNIDKTNNSIASLGNTVSGNKADAEKKIATVTQEAKAEVDNLKGSLMASFTFKATADGIFAGISAVADTSTGKGSMYITADDFMIITSKSAGTKNAVIPFAVQNGRVYINSAMIANASIGSAQINNAAIGSAHIQDGSISAAKIGSAQINNAHIVNGSINRAKITSWLASDNYVYNSSGMALDFAGGAIYINGNTPGEGRMEINNNQINVYDNYGRLRVRLGRL